jgi:uncharacterized membrane protein
VEHLVSTFALLLRQTLEGLSLLTVFAGVLRCLQLVSRHRLGAVRLTLGRWLSMALEFQLAADIVATTVNPNGEQLIQLAAVALIRTFLNVFLAREIAEERRFQLNGADRSAEPQPGSAGRPAPSPLPADL